MTWIGFGVPDSRKDLHGAEHETPQENEQRQRMRATRAMPPRPHGAPDAAGHNDRDGAEVGGEPKAAAHFVRPHDHPHAERDGKREARVHRPSAWRFFARRNWSGLSLRRFGF